MRTYRNGYKVGRSSLNKQKKVKTASKSVKPIQNGLWSRLQHTSFFGTEICGRIKIVLKWEHLALIINKQPITRWKSVKYARTDEWSKCTTLMGGGSAVTPRLTVKHPSSGIYHLPDAHASYITDLDFVHPSPYIWGQSCQTFVE